MRVIILPLKATWFNNITALYDWRSVIYEDLVFPEDADVCHWCRLDCNMINFYWCGELFAALVVAQTAVDCELAETARARGTKQPSRTCAFSVLQLSHSSLSSWSPSAFSTEVRALQPVGPASRACCNHNLSPRQTRALNYNDRGLVAWPSDPVKITFPHSKTILIYNTSEHC